jgi:hypothetical protein
MASSTYRVEQLRYLHISVVIVKKREGFAPHKHLLAIGDAESSMKMLEQK